jgi:hypothetical protein
MNLKKWAKENEAIVVVVASLFTIGAILVTAVRVIFAPPTLALTVQAADLRLPWYMYRRMDEALAADSARLSDSAGLALRQVRGFLRDTKTFTQIRLTNTSRVSLTNLDLRLRYVHDADGWAIEGDNLDLDEQARLVDAVKYDVVEGMITLHSIPRLPPKSSFTLFVWGDVAASPLLGSQQLTVTYDGGAGELITERTIRGVDAYIYDNSGLLVILLLLVNVALWGAYRDWKEKQLARMKTG